ncbi:MAG TPA: S8/S53 family peptidase [Sphingobacteriaceae bacterium]|nr:S8/S53 family peptidase [Sphingobacteriaceae bacterium]
MGKFLLLFLLAITKFAYGQDILKRPLHKEKFQLSPSISSKDYLVNTVIIKFKQGISNSAKTQAIRESLPTLKSASLVTFKKLFKDVSAPDIAHSSGVERTDIGLNRIYEVTYSGNAAVEQVINELLLDATIEYAEPRYIFHTSYLPNDPFISDQNYLNQIKAPQAWDFVRNSSSVLIGIVDSGSDLEHQDLAANIFLNTADPVNGLDDDRDGYVDNYRGWDFVGKSSSSIVEDNNPDVASDLSDHGVHVSGIASAVTDNSVGVSSISFNAKLLIVKAGADDDGTSIFRGYEGIKYAVDKGALIINCSWGGSGGGSYGADIINYALSKGCLVVAAAGNDNTDAPEYPAAYPGVMAVANVTSTDVRSGSSNYGYYVDITAPGNAILSTVNNNRYTSFSGTSMSAPMVSSTAALVKSRFPSFNMQQVGEQIRVTADFIDDKNPGFEAKLGKGRLNVFRAITVVSPSLRNQKLTIVDKTNGSIPAGDTIKISFDVKNFLSPASGAMISLSSLSPFVRILTPSVSAGVIGTNETKFLVGPFRVIIDKSIPDNTPVEFRIDYAANGNSYRDFEKFIIVAARDYLDVNVNQIATTMTSVGRIGYSKPESTDGQGFIYKGESLLYEASLMIGNSPSRVSNNARGTSGNWDEHFIKKMRATRVQGTSAAFDGRAEFDDSASPEPFNIHVNHRVLAYSSAPDDKYVIAEYEIKNSNTTDFSNLYIGMFADWDINGDGRDVTKYDAANRLGYVYAKTGSKLYAGVKLLSNASQPAYYPLSYQVQGNPLQSGGFTIAEKFETLSSGIKSLGLGESSANGYDVMFVIGSGPYTVKAGRSIKVAFAFLGGDNLNDLTGSAVAAQNKYESLNARAPLPAISDQLILKQNYPNPVTSFTTIEYNIPVDGKVELSLYNTLGQRVKNMMNQNISQGYYTIETDLSDLPEGVYICKLRLGNQERAVKVLVEK